MRGRADAFWRVASSILISRYLPYSELLQGVGANAAAAQADWHAAYAEAQPTEQTPPDMHIAIPAAAAHPAWHVPYAAGPHSTTPIREAATPRARVRVALLLSMIMMEEVLFC